MTTETGGPVVTIGSRVRVKEATLLGETTYRIVEPQDSDLGRSAISCDCPVGRALLGQRPGAEVRVAAPMGDLYVTVLAVEP